MTEVPIANCKQINTPVRSTYARADTLHGNTDVQLFLTGKTYEYIKILVSGEHTC
jgi:hypothetical protein